MQTAYQISECSVLFCLVVLILLCVHCRKAVFQYLVLISCIAALVAGCIYKETAVFCGGITTICISSGLVLLLWLLVNWPHWGAYRLPTHMVKPRFPTGRVLILVPHQDDELLLAGGILEDLQKTNEVYILFSTNGDYTDKHNLPREIKGQRLLEAMNAMSVYGIPADRVLFMGFGNEWKKDKENMVSHLYHAKSESILTSYSGENETWGTSKINCICSGIPYTRQNFVRILREQIHKLHPDTIICVDYDSHADHRALSLMFEETLAEEMKTNAGYTPFVLKGFAYSCAWNSPRDFYRENLRSVPSPMEGSTMKEAPFYNWQNRLRVPVSQGCLTRVLPGNLMYEAYMHHESQSVPLEGVKERIINGDHVYWWRPTGNILMQAEVDAESGEASALNDFLLAGSDDITNPEKSPHSHGWFPEPGKMTAHFILKKNAVISELHLYSAPDECGCILNCRITLSNGVVLETGPISTQNGAHVVPTGCCDVVNGFTLELLETSGTHPGLVEVEAYSKKPIPIWKIIKLQDADGNFMYDYTLPEHGYMRFSLYAWPAEAAKNHHIYLEKQGKQTQLKPDSNGVYEISLKHGENAELIVLNEKNQIVDSAYISNSTRITRFLLSLQRKLDKHIRNMTIQYGIHYYRHLFSKKLR